MTKLPQKSLQYKVLQFIKKNNLISSGENVVVAVSGGADSVCLFDVLYKLQSKLNFSIFVCHYNHRLRGKDSYNDLEFVKKLALSREVEFIGGEAKVDNLFKNEEEARVARYGFYEKILQEGRGDKVAIGHNLNDLAETFFMRLLRGSGLRGLKSIPYRRKNFIRPLLAVPRFEIEAYLEHENLSYREDATNKQTVHTRNLIRHEILPRLLEINPNLLEIINNTVSSIEEDYNLIDQMTEKNYKKLVVKDGKNQIILDRKKWLLLHPALQMGILRLAIAKISNLADITQKQLDEVRGVIYRGEGKKQKLLPHSLRIQLLSGKIVLLIEKTN